MCRFLDVPCTRSILPLRLLLDGDLSLTYQETCDHAGRFCYLRHCGIPLWGHRRVRQSRNWMISRYIDYFLLNVSMTSVPCPQIVSRKTRFSRDSGLLPWFPVLVDSCVWPRIMKICSGLDVVKAKFEQDDGATKVPFIMQGVYPELIKIILGCIRHGRIQRQTLLEDFGKEEAPFYTLPTLREWSLLIYTQCRVGAIMPLSGRTEEWQEWAFRASFLCGYIIRTLWARTQKIVYDDKRRGGIEKGCRCMKLYRWPFFGDVKGCELHNSACNVPLPSSVWRIVFPSLFTMK